MVRRRGVGASLAAVFIFSTLLISNFTLLASADQREKLSLTAYTESRYADEAVVLAGTESLKMLVSLQGYLASRPLECSTAGEQAARFVLSLSASAKQDGLTVNESVIAGASTGAKDNLSVIRPFNGSYAGGVNFAAEIRWSASSPLEDVRFDKVEDHLLNLPVLLATMVSLCESAVGRYRAFLQGVIFPACNYSSIGPAMASVGQSFRDEAAGEGLVLQVSYELAAASVCHVVLTLQVAQLEIPGPGGEFNVRVEEVSLLPILIGG